MGVAVPLDDVVPVYALMAEPRSLTVARWLPYPFCIQSVAGYHWWEAPACGRVHLRPRGPLSPLSLTARMTVKHYA